MMEIGELENVLMFPIPDDCDDNNPNVYPMAGDTYGDGVDSDCDGLDCEGWSQDGHYYLFYPDSMNRHDAEANCYSANMDLVSIESSSEITFLETLSSAPNYNAGPIVWIGLHDEDLDGNYEWNDGSAMNFTSWCGGGLTGQGSRKYAHFEFGLGCWALNGGVNGMETWPYFCESQ